MQIGAFRRQVAKTLTTKATKTALRTLAKSTVRTQVAQATVALKGHTGQLLQTNGQYLLGLQQSQEMKDDAFRVMGDIGYDLTVLCRVLKVKMPSATKRAKLQGTRSAALLQLDSLATDLLRQTEHGLFASPKTTTVKKLVTMPHKGGVKEERDVEVIDSQAEAEAETARQAEMKSYLTGAVDVYWRLTFDLFGQSPVAVLEAKLARMHQEFPGVSFEAKEAVPA